MPNVSLLYLFKFTPPSKSNHIEIIPDEKKGVSMSSLFEINSQIEELSERLIDPETGELDDEVMAQLDQLAIDQDEKLEAYGMKIKSLEAEIDAIAKEKKRFDKRVHAKAALIDKLMEKVSQTLGGKPKEYTNVTFSFRKSESVEIGNEDAIPEDYCDYETRKKPVKAKIKDAIKRGVDVPGAVLIEKQNLQVK